MKVNKNIKIFINYLLGPLLFIWLSWSIYYEIKNQADLTTAWLRIKSSFSTPLAWNLLAVLLLMLVNWSVETLKWKISIEQVQKVSFFRAFRAVWSGISFSVSTPNRVGEYLGRVLYMDDGNRLKTISLTIVGSISQLMVTLFMGCFGLLFLRSYIEAGHVITAMWLDVIFFGVLTVLIVLTLFYFRLSWLVRWVDKLPGTNRFVYLVKALENFNATLLFKLLSLSLLRFIIFIVQYYLLFCLFDVSISWWQSFWSVSISFLVLAVIPSFAIADVGLRGKVAIKLIGLFAANELGILFTTVTIWFVNLIIPAIAGSLFIVGIKKIYTEKDAKT